MNKWIAGLFGAALIANVAFADAGAPAPSAKDLTKAVEKVNYVETDTAGIKLSGYVDVNYLYKFYSPDRGDFSVNQVKIQLEKPLTDKNEWQAGFLVGAYLGEGNENATGDASDLALSQAYVNARIPVGNGIDVKAGKFVSWIGYESPETPANLNITSGAAGYFQPVFLTGVAAEYKFNDIIDAGVGIVNGSGLDSNFGDNGATTYDGYALTAKINFTLPSLNANWQHALYYSWDAAGEDAFTVGTGSGQLDGALIIYDGVINWVPKFTDGKLLLGANYDVGNWQYRNDAEATWLTGALYAKYQFTDLFSLAARGTYVHAVFADQNADVWGVTLTAGFNVAENLILRTEYRFDFGNFAGDLGGYVPVGHDSGHTVAVEAVYVF
jgi:hypothetical protein